MQACLVTVAESSPVSRLQLERLHLEDAQWATDAGLAKALPRCRTLKRVYLQGCWLITEAGLQAAAAAALDAGGCLQEAVRDGTQLELSAPAAPAEPGAPSGGIGSATPSQQRRGGAARLTAAVLEHDERLAYSTGELLGLQQSPAASAGAARLRAHLPQDLRTP